VSAYVDELRDYGWRLGPSCHLIADTLDELHEFAARVGMKRAWFQDAASAPHYDLVASRRKRAVTLGAIELDRRAFVMKCRELRKPNA
jgi:hypothetical protein